jgi:isopenicillin N synthase-like dioxygenase
LNSDVLNKAILICQLNEAKKGDKGDTARFIRRLADAMEAKGNLAQAQLHRIQAEAIRQEIQGERFYRLPDCERSYNLMVFKAFW